MGQYEVDGVACWFVSQERMLKGIENNEFLEHNNELAEQDTHIYGITFESVREVMKENKLCVIDSRPEVCILFLKFDHRGHSQTMWTEIWTFLTPLPLLVDHFT